MLIKELEVRAYKQSYIDVQSSWFKESQCIANELTQYIRDGWIVVNLIRSLDESSHQGIYKLLLVKPEISAITSNEALKNLELEEIKEAFIGINRFKGLE